MADRWVIVAEGPDGPAVFGPAVNRTYASSEKARKDADAIEPDWEHTDVVRVRGIEEA